MTSIDQTPLVKVYMPPREELMPALEDILYSGMLAEGEVVYEFERKFSEKFKINHTLAFSSGTACLHTALLLSNVKVGDEVISTPMTAEPTNTSILYCGAKVVWADIDPISGNLDPASVESSITPKTKAIIVVHYGGYPARLKELRAIADKYGVPLIEDCAHALGATYDGNAVGSVGDFSIFSFQAIKHMTTIDGGVLVLKNSDQLDAAKKIRWFGMLKGVPRTEVDINSIGYKYNMNNVMASIGLVQLGSISNILDKHISNGKYYDQSISNIQGLNFAKVDQTSQSSYWLYTLLSEYSSDLEKALNSRGVQASKLHRPNNKHSIFFDSKKNLPGLDKFYKQLLHIPCGWWVSDSKREEIISILKQG
ncbi:DegT/DnrJ/EryC1/StrS family aminotransferase [Polynucleobacter paneuropaeus]|nr:DegT/DnrJ/EryC1/StrS family aminotransferase [Polynucleobacter paneuropaeus]